MPYVILVDDNYHYMDSSYRCRDGEFATAEEAFARCRQIVDEYLDDADKIEGRESATGCGRATRCSARTRSSSRRT